MDDSGDFQLLLIPKDGSQTRSWEFSARKVRLFKITAITLGVSLAALALSWVFMAAQLARIPGLEAEVAALSAEREQVMGLAAQLEAIETQYGSLRSLFGADSIRDPSDLWLPPANRPTRGPPSDPTNARPTSWPLSQPGFITQALLDGADAEHPGLDIAVPTDTYIRASGAGIVVAVGEDPVYGFFVQLDHGEGLTTLYGHASRTMVAEGQQVRRNEVIALSGNSGRSTAPHLHFEIRLNGEPIDPLEFVRQPS